MSNMPLDCEHFLATTAGPPPMYELGARCAITVVLAMIVIVCIVGNALVIVCVATRRSFRTITNAFIVSRAVADCGVGVLVMPYQVYEQYNNKEWNLGETFCLVTTSFDVMLCTVSIFHLACIIIERYLAVCKPALYQELMKPQFVIGVLAGCWILPIFVSFVPILNKWNHIGIEEMLECILPPENVCAFFVSVGFAWICSIISWYVPALVMASGWKIHQSVKSQKGSLDEKQAELAKTFLIAVLLSYMCWFPFFMCNVIDPTIGYKVSFNLWTVLLWVGYSNCSMHPVLYYITIKDFKMAFNKTIKCKFSEVGVDETK